MAKNSIFEIITIVDIEFYGTVEALSNELSNVKGQFILRFFSKANDNLLEKLLSSNDSNQIENSQKKIKTLIELDELSLSILVKLEVAKTKTINNSPNGNKVVLTDDTLNEKKLPFLIQLFFKNQTAIEYDLLWKANKYIHSLKSFIAFQIGVKMGSICSFYAKWKSSARNEIKFGIALGEEIISNKEQVKQIINDIVAIDEIYEIKFKRYVQFAPNVKSGSISDANSSQPIKISEYQPYILYSGILLLLGIYGASIKHWSIPFFKTYDTAYVFATIITCIGASIFSHKKKNTYVSLGILFFTLGGLTLWQGWELPICKTYEFPIIIGALFLIIGLIPNLISVPMFFGGIYILWISIDKAYTINFNSVPIQNWIISVAMLALATWLTKRHKDLDENGRFR